MKFCWPRSGVWEGEREAKPLSSIFDVSSEDDIVRCLMLLSRNAWARSEEVEDQQSSGCGDAGVEDKEYNDKDGEDADDGSMAPPSLGEAGSGAGTSVARARSSSDWRSYQALGGHRASHKKVARGGCIPAAAGLIGGEVSSSSALDDLAHLPRSLLVAARNPLPPPPSEADAPIQLLRLPLPLLGHPPSGSTFLLHLRMPLPLPVPLCSPLHPDVPIPPFQLLHLRPDSDPTCISWIGVRLHVDPIRLEDPTGQ